MLLIMCVCVCSLEEIVATHPTVDVCHPECYHVLLVIIIIIINSWVSRITKRGCCVYLPHIIHTMLLISTTTTTLLLSFCQLPPCLFNVVDDGSVNKSNVNNLGRKHVPKGPTLCRSMGGKVNKTRGRKKNEDDMETSRRRWQWL